MTVREVHDLLAIAAVPTLMAAVFAADWVARWFARSFNPAWLLCIKKRRVAAAPRSCSSWPTSSRSASYTRTAHDGSGSPRPD